MTVVTRSFQFHTNGLDDVIDITEKVQEVLKRSKLSSGVATVFIPGSIASITTIEHEPGLVKDIKTLGERIAPSNEEYGHNATWGDGNGFSHVRAAVIGPSLAVPFDGKKLLLGTWQQIVVIDHDNRGRDRTLIVQVMGE